jgi:hypothetical protein
VKRAFKGKRFQDVEDIKRKMTTSATVSRNLLKGATNVFKYVDITLNRNKTIFDFLVLFIYFFTPVRGLFCQASYLCESSFPAMGEIKSKNRNRLLLESN